MLISVVFFIFISLAIIAGLVGPTVREFQNAGVNLNSKQSYFLAESGNEDAYYRIKNSITIGSSVPITLGSNTETTAITTPTGYSKQITSTGNVSNYDRVIGLTLQTGAGASFNYGLQAGSGGITMSGGTTLNGNVYSNGDINAISATITGTAVAADSPALAIDQSNTAPSTPTNSINFRDTATTIDFAQSFQVSDNLPINKIQLYIKKVGAPANTTIRLVTDNAGSPSTTTIPIGSISLTAASVTTSFAWVEIPFTTNTSLVTNTTYWIVVDNSSSSSSNYYVLGANANTSYASGTAKTGVYNGTWNATGFDSYFKIYTGGASGMIGGAGYATGVMIGSAGVGDAWASNVQGATVAANLYCTTGSNNNKACNTGHGIPAQVDLPFTDQNITDWKTAANTGGTITGSTKCPGGSSGGDCIVDWHNATFGPGKITGDLTINGGGTLTLTGTIWVVGSVTITGGGKIQLPSSYGKNSETIVSDNIVDIGGGGSLGSGTSGSYLFIVSTSRCPYDTYCSGNSAITVSGGAGAIAVDAQNGDVLLNGGASLDAAVGNSMTLTGGADVTYNAGLASPSFSNGPSGSWTVQTWGETQ